MFFLCEDCAYAASSSGYKDPQGKDVRTLHDEADLSKKGPCRVCGRHEDLEEVDGEYYIPFDFAAPVAGDAFPDELLPAVRRGIALIRSAFSDPGVSVVGDPEMGKPWQIEDGQGRPLSTVRYQNAAEMAAFMEGIEHARRYRIA